LLKISKETESFIRKSGKLATSKPVSVVPRNEPCYIVLDDDDEEEEEEEEKNSECPASTFDEASSKENDYDTSNDSDNDVQLIKFTPGRSRNFIFTRNSEKSRDSEQSSFKNTSQPRARNITNIVSNDNSTTVNIIAINYSNLININSEMKGQGEPVYNNNNSSSFYDFFNSKSGYNLRRSESRSLVINDKKRKIQEELVDLTD
jgi:hypothetical protein